MPHSVASVATAAINEVPGRLAAVRGRWKALGVPDPDFSGRVALVTGASGGIGAELATRLAASGAAVAVHYVTGRDRAVQVAESITAGGGRAGDLPRRPERRPRARAAGRGGRRRARADRHPVRECRAQPPGLLRGDRRGRLRRDDRRQPARSVPARAPLAARNARPRIRPSPVHLVGRGPDRRARRSALRRVESRPPWPHPLPGFPSRRRWRDGERHRAGADRADRHASGRPGDLARRIPVGRLGTPGEVADLAMAVLRNGYVTNQVISVDGGMHPR